MIAAPDAPLTSYLCEWTYPDLVNTPRPPEPGQASSDNPWLYALTKRIEENTGFERAAAGILVAITYLDIRRRSEFSEDLSLDPEEYARMEWWWTRAHERSEWKRMASESINKILDDESLKAFHDLAAEAIFPIMSERAWKRVTSERIARDPRFAFRTKAFELETQMFQQKLESGNFKKAATELFDFAMSQDIEHTSFLEDPWAPLLALRAASSVKPYQAEQAAYERLEGVLNDSNDPPWFGRSWRAIVYRRLSELHKSAGSYAKAKEYLYRENDLDGGKGAAVNFAGRLKDIEDHEPGAR